MNQRTVKKSKHFILGVCNCGCGEEINIRSSSYLRTFKKGHNRRGLSNGPNHPRWKGGVTYDGEGYRLIKSPSHPNKNSRGYVYHHRLVMEEYLGRYLTKDEEINHLNKDVKDNRIENLEILSKSAHATKHLIGNKRNFVDMSGRICVDCNSPTTSIDKSKNRPHWYRKGDGWQCVCCNRKEMRKKKRSSSC